MRGRSRVRPISAGFAAAALVAMAAAGVAAERPRAAGRDVAFATADGMSIAATWWDETALGAAGVVLVHGAGSNRAKWEPLVPHFRARGVEVLAIDLRGHGGSARQNGVDLGPLAKAGDTTLFPEMHADVIAAVRWLVKEGRCARDRIAVVADDVGGLVALDAARVRPSEIAAVVVSTPVAKMYGLDAKAFAPGTASRSPASLLLVADFDVDAGARVLHALYPASRLLVRPEGKRRLRIGPDGPRELVDDRLERQTVASYVAARTGSKVDDVVLDGIIETKGPHADPWMRATRVEAGGDGRAWAYRSGRRIAFGGIAPKDCVAVVIELDDGRGPEDIDLPFAVALDLEDEFEWYRSTPSRSAGNPFEPTSRLERAGGGDLPAAEEHPAFHAVPGPDGTTFEGEWTMGADPVETAAVRFRVRFEREVPKSEPAKLGAAAARAAAARAVLPSR